MASRTALITGASAGIGKVFAEKLSEQKYNLILIARRKNLLETQARAYTNSHDVSVEIISADLSSKEGIQKAIDGINRADDLDLLVNNAGFGTPGLFHELSIKSQFDMNSVHILAAIQLIHACLPGMIKRGRGDVINVSSLSGFIPAAKGVTYCSTKAYLNMFSRAMKYELRGTGVHMQALCPGFTRTKFHDAAGYTGEELSKIPKWLWMSAERVVDTSLKALKKKKVIVVPGKRYKLISFLVRNPITSGFILSRMNKMRK